MKAGRGLLSYSSLPAAPLLLQEKGPGDEVVQPGSQ